MRLAKPLSPFILVISSQEASLTLSPKNLVITFISLFILDIFSFSTQVRSTVYIALLNLLVGIKEIESHPPKNLMSSNTKFFYILIFLQYYIIL